MKSILLLVAAILIANVGLKIQMKKKKQERRLRETRGKREELLRVMKNTAKYEPGGYEGETKEKMTQLIEKKYELNEKVLAFDFNQPSEAIEKEVMDYVASCASFSARYLEHIQSWETLEKEIEEFIHYMQQFYEKNTFYPHEFVHDTNRVQRTLETVREERRMNPLGTFETYQEIFQQAKQSVETFESLHEEVTNLLHKRGVKEADSEIKHHLYIALTQGNYEEARRWLKKLKKHA